MTYSLITNRDSPNFSNRKRTVRGITIHWWGDPAQRPTFEGTVSYLCRAGGNTSAHYIVEAGRAACIVDPDVIAWHAGNNTGNNDTIGIECNPRATDGDYQTIAELVRDLRAAYGDLYIVGHRHWKATACPGVYDVSRIDRLARNLPSPSTPTEIKPTPQEDIMGVTREQNQADIRAIVKEELKDVLSSIPRDMAYYIPDTHAWFRSTMGGRQWVTAQMNGGGRFDGIPLDASNDFWKRPVTDEFYGQGFQREGSPEVYILIEGELKHVNPDSWAWLNETGRVTEYQVLPVNHKLWSLPGDHQSKE